MNFFCLLLTLNKQYGILTVQVTQEGYIMTIGEKLLMLRTREQKTREDVAKSVGVSPQAIYKYETGIITNIPLDRIAAFSRLYNVTPSYLMGWEDSSSPLSEEEKKLILAYRAHPEMQDAVNRLLGIEKQPERKLSPTVSDIKPKTYIVRTAGRGEGVKDVEMTAEEIEFYKNLPDVDETDL